MWSCPHCITLRSPLLPHHLTTKSPPLPHLTYRHPNTHPHLHSLTHRLVSPPHAGTPTYCVFTATSTTTREFTSSWSLRRGGSCTRNYKRRKMEDSTSKDPPATSSNLLRLSCTYTHFQGGVSCAYMDSCTRRSGCVRVVSCTQVLDYSDVDLHVCTHT